MMTLAHSAVSRETISETGNAQPDFEDAFLCSWISARLGTTELRPLLLLEINQSADAISAEAGDLLRSAADHVVERQPGELIGVWGTKALAPDLVNRVLRTADTLCAHHGVRCLLHSRVTEIDKQVAEFTQIEQGALWAMAQLSGQFPLGSANALRRPLLSDAFRAFCDITSGLLPVSSLYEAPQADAAPMHLLVTCDRPTDSGGASDSSGFLRTASLDALGDLKPLVLAAAIAGPKFSETVLADMLNIQPTRLRPALDALCQRGFVSPASSEAMTNRSTAAYAFNCTHTHKAAYNAVPARFRLKLHRLAAGSDQSSGLAPVQARSAPDAIARHHQLARNPRQSMRWLSKAAWHAITRGDTTAAISHLQEALAEHAEPAETNSLRRTLLQLLGIQLAVTKGNGSDAVFETYLRSVAVAEETGSLAWGQQFRSLWLAQTCHAVKGEVRAALTIGNLLLNQLNQRGEVAESALGRRILCQRVQALSRMLGGQLQSAITLYDAVINHYRPELHAVLRFAYGSDQLALAHAHQAWAFALMGDTHNSRASARLARNTADALQHQHTSAHVLGVLGIAAFASGRIDEAALITREARAIAAINNFEYWLPWCDVVLAACEARQSPRNGYDRLQSAMERYRETDAAQLCPYIFAELSKAALRDRRYEQALADANSGIMLTRLNGCIIYRPELQRQRARALLRSGDCKTAHDALDDGYHEAMSFGAGRFADQIARDGMRLTRSHQQLIWQQRYHAALQE